MSKIIIIEGNSNDKDNFKAYMVKGEKGDKGDKGDTGPIGDNHLQIGTVTSGATASAEIVGESPNQTLNLVLPKGEKGEKGEKGDMPTVHNQYSDSTSEPYSAHFTNELNSYSSIEKKIGTYIDENDTVNDLYDKTIFYTLTSTWGGPLDTTLSIPHGIQNLKDIIDISAIIKGTDNWKMPYISFNTNDGRPIYTNFGQVGATNVIGQCFNTTWNAGSVIKITLKYTKTTS